VEQATTEEIRLILKMISRGYKVPKAIHDVIFDVAKREIEDAGKVVIYKRDPNVHSARSQGAYVKIVEGSTMEVHPAASVKYGFDFDGDSSYCFLRLYRRENENYIPMRIHISDFCKQFRCELEYEKRKNGGRVVKNYSVLDEIFCQAINNDGKIEYKKISHWSIHENIKMFSVNRRKKNTLIGDVKELWISNNHSVVAIDYNQDEIRKVTPEEIIEDPKRYYLIRSMSRPKTSKDARSFILNEEIQNNITEEKFGYYIGALLGDGDISQRISLLHSSNTDIGNGWTNIAQELLEDFIGVPPLRNQLREYDHPYNLKDKNGNGYKPATRWGYNRKVPFNINQFGNTCSDKHLPDWVLNSTDDFVMGLFAGYIDTDGMVRPRGVSATSKSKKLIEDVRYVLYYRLGIESSISVDIKNYTLGIDGQKIPIIDPAEYRHYYVLYIPIRKEYSEFLIRLQTLLNHPEKKRKLREYIEIVKSTPPLKRGRIVWCPKKLLKHPDFTNTDDVTNDVRYCIRNKNYTQKSITIPSHIIEESNISESFKNLLHKQNAKEIEIIPATCLNIQHDPNKTIGYDFTVEDYKTFTTDTGIFLYDTMALYAPMSEEAQQEVKDKMITVHSKDSINDPIFELTKDVIVGIFTLTAATQKDPKVKSISSIADAEKLHIAHKVEMTYKGKKIKTTAGRIIFNNVLPQWYPFVDADVSKKTITNILKEIIEKSDVDFANTTDRLMRLGFKYNTIYPKTLNLEQLKIPPHLIKMKDELSATKIVSEQSDILDKIEVALLKHFKDTNSDLYYIVASGGSKGMNQIRQMMVCKGLVQDPMGNVLPPITKSINEGYTPKEYFEAAAGSRKGTIDRSLNTGAGGYGYRKMIYVVGNVQADVNNGNCGTRQTLQLKLTEDLFKRMTGRFVHDEKGVLKPLTKDMIGRVINLRSPIFCKSKKICRTCYGKLLAQLKTENVGMVAVQQVASLSEKIMKSSKGLVYHNDRWITMDDLWDNIDVEPVIEGDLETKEFVSSIQGKDGMVKTSVMQKHPPKDKMIVIGTNTGHILVCQADHPLWIKKNPICKWHKNSEFRLVGKETYTSWHTKYLIAEDNEVVEKLAGDVVKGDAIWIDNEPFIINKDRIRPKTAGYVIGAYCARGSVGKKSPDTIDIRIENEDQIDRLIRESERLDFKLKEIEKRSTVESATYVVFTYNKDIVEGIVLGIGVGDVRLAPDFLSYNKDWLKSFLAGYLDTIGAMPEHGCTRFSTYIRSYNLTQQFKMISLKLGYHTTISALSNRFHCKDRDARGLVEFVVKICIPAQKEMIPCEKVTEDLEFKPMSFKKNDNPIKGFDPIMVAKEIYTWIDPVYDIKTETNEFMLGAVQNHNSFHLGGVLILNKLDIIKELMTKVDDYIEPKIRESFKQEDDDLFSNSEFVMLRINKSIYEHSPIVKEKEYLDMKVGHFTLTFGDLEIPVAIEKPIKIYTPEEVEEDDSYISYMYTKGDKILYAEPTQENFTELARELDKLVGGKYPWQDVSTIYNKFYKALAATGGWDSSHLEVIISNILRAKKDPQQPARLIEPFNPEMYSIKTLPSIISWPLGFSFENFGKAIQYGMISDRAPESPIEKVLMGIPLTEERQK